MTKFSKITVSTEMLKFGDESNNWESDQIQINDALTHAEVGAMSAAGKQQRQE